MQKRLLFMMILARYCVEPVETKDIILLTQEQYEKITKHLTQLYGKRLYERNGITHPIVVFTPQPDQINDVDSVLGDAPRQLLRAEDMAFYNQAYLQTLKNSGRNLFNGTTFVHKRLRRKPLKLSAELGKYFDMLATCAALDDELKDAAAGQLIRLPGRSQLHRHLPPDQAMINGRGRSAAIGVACLTVFNHEGTYKAMLARRSERAATDPLHFHVLPAFIFQPSDEQWTYPEEWSVAHQVYREYLEELFGFDEISSPARYDYFYEHPALQYLKTLMARGEAALYLTGITINLLTLRPEISTLLLIHTPAWYARITAPNSDMPLNTHAEAHGGTIYMLPIRDDAAVLAELPENVHTMMPPQAVGALWMGVDLARQRIPSQS